MNLSKILAAAVLALASSNSFAADVSFKAWSLAEVYFTNIQTNQSIIVKPQITGSTKKGDLKGYVNIKLPEGVYLLQGQAHMPAELGTVCQIEDRVVVVKSKLDSDSAKSPAFGYATSATGEARFKQVCWEDFDLINQVPDFREE